jgi:hypothetical protein
LIFPDEIEETRNRRVLNVEKLGCAFAIPVDRVESPSCVIKKLDAMDVLSVEKVVKKLDVVPIVVERVLNPIRTTLESAATPELTELTATCKIEKLLQVIVEKEENPERKSVPTVLIPTRSVLVSWPTSVE